MTTAHEVDRVLKEQVFYPAHDHRTESPEYAKAHHHLAVELDLPCLICGVRNSTLKDPAANKHGSKQMETHHHIIEWALQNAIDLAKFNENVWPALKARHPGKYPAPFTQQEMLDFIDHSVDNLWVLCLTPDTKVLMGDGTRRRIDQVGVGDEVIGKDGKPHKVTHVRTTPSDGHVYSIDGVKASGNHPFLTPDGWKRADELAVGEIVYEVGVLAPQMLRLRSIKAKILDAIVRPVAVYVMDALGSRERPSNVALHDVSVLHDAPVAPGFHSNPNPDVSPRAGLGAVPLAVGPLAAVECRETARVGTVLLDPALRDPRLDLEADSADGAGNRGALVIGRAARNDGEPSPAGHRAVFGRRGSARNDGEGVSAGAGFLDPSFRGRRTRHIETLTYEGPLYDITVEDSASFVAGGLVVHNCDVHHRHSLVGIHSITGPIWGAQNLVRDDFTYIPENKVI